MPKSPDKQNHRENVDRKSSYSLKFRLAVAFILGLAVGGVAMKLVSHADKPKRDKTTEIIPYPSAGQKDSSDGNPVLPVMWKNPKGKLITENEVLEKANEIETQRRMSFAENIIRQNCIREPGDQEKIRNTVLAVGYSDINSSEIIRPWLANRMYFFPEKLQGLCELHRENCRQFPLKSSCRALTEEEEADVKKYKADLEEYKRNTNKMADLVGSGRLSDALADIDIQELEKSIRQEGLEKSIGGELLEMVKYAKGQSGRVMDPKGRLIFCGKLESFFKGQWMKRADDENEAINNNTTIKNAFEILQLFSNEITRSQGFEEHKACLDDFYKVL